MRTETIGNATLYLGDCLAILPSLPVADAVITDPPYGINYKPLRGGDGSKLFTEPVHDDDKPFDPAPFLSFKKLVLWGGNNYASRLPDNGGWLVWDKTPMGMKRGFAQSHAELAWTNCGRMVRKFPFQWGGEAHGGEPHYHPTQKPVALLEWCLQIVGDAELILDPFMGSCPVGIASLRAGRKFIGVEISPVYFEIACERLTNELKQEKLFA
jgi:site-specific DNA-methyltransferase (adenine-specific)